MTIFKPLTDHLPAITAVKCGNCAWTDTIDVVNPIEDAQTRLQAGGEVAAGECPDCGALAYLIAPADVGRTVWSRSFSSARSAREMAHKLIDLGCSFTADPMPHGNWEITVKDEDGPREILAADNEPDITHETAPARRRVIVEVNHSNDGVEITTDDPSLLVLEYPWTNLREVAEIDPSDVNRPDWQPANYVSRDGLDAMASDLAHRLEDLIEEFEG